MRIKIIHYVIIYLLALLLSGSKFLAEPFMAAIALAYFPVGLFIWSHKWAENLGLGIVNGLTLFGYAVYVTIIICWIRYRKTFLFFLFIAFLCLNVVSCRHLNAIYDEIL